MSLISLLVKELGKPKLHNIDLKYIVLKTCLVHYKLLREHEGTLSNRVYMLKKVLESAKLLKYPLLVDARTFTILNGHHRFHALVSLGYEYIPIFPVDYAEDYVEVYSLRKEFKVSKIEVIKRSLSKRKYSPRTSKHILVGVNLPSSNIKLESLKRGYFNTHCILDSII
ncbi:MAG: transcriptional regulator [Desulfurococcales archaeon ex4484_42]|nr:MAG: transcriptional regulator [Desulfurococcales archaeon ex4484_42]